MDEISQIEDEMVSEYSGIPSLGEDFKDASIPLTVTGQLTRKMDSDSLTVSLDSFNSKVLTKSEVRLSTTDGKSSPIKTGGIEYPVIVTPEPPTVERGVSPAQTVIDKSGTSTIILRLSGDVFLSGEFILCRLLPVQLVSDDDFCFTTMDDTKQNQIEREEYAIRNGLSYYDEQKKIPKRENNE